MTREKISDPGFHKHFKNRSFFACIDRKRGKDDIQLEGFNAYYSPRTDLKNGEIVRCTDGGVVLFVADKIKDSYFVKDHTTEAFPEVVAVEFLGSFFSVEKNSCNVYFLFRYCCKQAISRETSYFPNECHRRIHTCFTTGRI